MDGGRRDCAESVETWTVCRTGVETMRRCTLWMKPGGGSRPWGRLFWMLAAIFTAAVGGRAVAQTIVLEGGRIIPVSGETIKKGSILIRGSKILAVGKTVEVPFDAKVIDVSGKTLFPGMIDVHVAGLGLDRPNENVPVAPFLNVYDAIDPSLLFFEDALRDGIAVLHLMQGNDCVIGGLSRVVHPIGMTPDEMTIVPDLAIKIAITPKTGFDRMLQMATLREAFLKFADDMERLAEERYEEKLRDEKKDLDVPPAVARERGRALIRDEDIPDKDRNLLLLTRGKLPAFIYCGRAMDVPRAIKIAKDNGFFERCVLVLGSECYKAVDVLKEAGRPVVLDAELIHRETDPITGKEIETFVPGVMDEAGVTFALQRRSGTSLGERYLWYQAARCVREGISRAAALEAITLRPAQMLGLGDRFGTLEPGKDASILVLSGDPLDSQTWVEKVIIEGVPVYDKAEDIRLKKLFATPEEELGGAAGDADEKSPGTSKPAASGGQASTRKTTTEKAEEPAGDGSHD